MNVKVMQVGPIGTNCYFLMDDDSKELAVIDPGDESERIYMAIQKMEGYKVRYILLTHGHYDHTTGVPGLAELVGPVDIYINRADAHGAGNTIFPLSDQVPGLKFYDDGDVLMLGKHEIHVIYTPGHSPGSVVLRVEDVLFTGDTLFEGSCGRTDLPGGNYGDILDSLRRLYELEGDFHVCPGHGGMSTLQRERRTNPFMREAMRGN